MVGSTLIPIQFPNHHPQARRPMTVEELAEFNGAGEVPEGRVDPPLYVGIKGKVYDVSYGGFDMYKPGTTYNIFAGKVSGVVR